MEPHRESDDITTDLLVIGGGISGVGIARDAAGRGLKVLLCEQDDLAQHTSSASTKLIHGGLRYLEQYDFKLVRHALHEREVLLRIAPHIIRPLRFILPHHPGLRPKWLIRIGLFLYDHLGGRKLLPASRGVNLRRHPAGSALKAEFTAGFEYADCAVADARLVVLTAKDAENHGAEIRTHCRCIELQRSADRWIATLRDESNGTLSSVTSKVVINAAGPWVDKVESINPEARTRPHIRFVKGSHIVVPKLFDHEFPYIFQHSDGRVLFAIPFERRFTLLGTTDLELDQLPEQVLINDDEINYICEAANNYFDQPVSASDVVWSYSGIRPLYDDASDNASKVTRDYNLHLDTKAAPLLSVYGGKITTYRRLAEDVLDLLAHAIDIPGSHWTAGSPLPGGDIANADFAGFLERCRGQYDWLPEEQLNDYAHLYGTRIDRLLDGCTGIESLGQHFGGPLYECEVRYLIENEYARSAEDILWRRTKKGLYLSAEEIRELALWINGGTT